MSVRLYINKNLIVSITNTNTSRNSNTSYKSSSSSSEPCETLISSGQAK